MLKLIVRYTCLFLSILFFIGSPNRSQAQSVKSQTPENPVESLLDFASRHLHIPYRSGGMSKKGFDCSGFVRYCYQQWNVLLPHSSAAQAHKGEDISLEEAQPGDLIFFKGSSTKSSQIGHVGIITEVKPNQTVRFIHSAFKGGVRYDLLSSDYYRRRFVAVRRVLLPTE
ncbi:C40 family peptidase [Arundinibacter roseus]|uniref:NlpC/P60 family protein n=1 Tax=Arundinibacter roseus TaxID=2070510 RepID=A0A4R4KGH0_9BACT|nr:C40 family peptidase [Arundinibacter roseus]TDB66022.1 NlpC/P60 family protein [Arundinibacter roseus]